MSTSYYCVIPVNGQRTSVILVRVLIKYIVNLGTKILQAIFTIHLLNDKPFTLKML